MKDYREPHRHTEVKCGTELMHSKQKCNYFIESIKHFSSMTEFISFSNFGDARKQFTIPLIRISLALFNR